uniref:Uncharacterized protein n=1 Tax=Megaselia scalaris TaxID=36166 RepID=T1GB20_MEGSC
MSLSQVFSPDVKVYNAYVFWSAVLVIKLLAMSLLTAMNRFKNKAFANPEDLPSKKLKVKFDDPDTELLSLRKRKGEH